MTIDTAVNTLMQQIQNPILTSFSELIDKIFQPEILIALSIILGIFLYLKKQKTRGIMLTLTMLIAGVAVLLLKQIVQRVRPSEAISLGSNYSFPSGHATMAVVFFGLMAFLFMNKKYKTTTIALTTFIILVVGTARLYLQVHWLTDVLAGFVLGGIILTLAILINNKTSFAQ